MRRAWLVLGAIGALIAEPAMAQAADVQTPDPPAALTDRALGEQRGGLATPLGVDIGFGASVRTYVDGSLALETRLTWTADGVQADRVFESEAARSLTASQAGNPTRAPVQVAAGTSVIHDLAANRIASVILNTANDRVIRQETDVTLHLPQLPDLQQRIGSERLGQALQGLSPQAAGRGQ
ncbi:hypothetical protein [Phenylobacterium sp.]|jgi:hypothetical protein|uniref:hypothetical protein n=1 Tax=Phenylobacterium sp. TaxID=1871053 RepID=UPI002F946342